LLLGSGIASAQKTFRALPVNATVAEANTLKKIFKRQTIVQLDAKAVYQYLIDFGIPATKISYRGVGNSQPIIVSPKNDEERRRNMRVEVFIIR